MLKKKITSQRLTQALQTDGEGILSKVMQGYAKFTIDDDMPVFTESHLAEIAQNVDYGVLRVLDGTWASYKNPEDQGMGTGIHTTIMPSPGTNPETNPGKYSFECEEYLEVLKFDIVKGGVRNRGGANEQFCGAVKYEQSIQSVNKFENSDSECSEIIYTPIHEENGMYLWLSNVLNHAASKESIEKDRGILAGNNISGQPQDGYQDQAQFILEDGSIVTESELNGRAYTGIRPAKDLAAGAGRNGPYYIPDYTLSRSGVIPHGSTITLLGNLAPAKGKYLIAEAPVFCTDQNIWDFDHLAISSTMGGADTRSDGQINLDKPAPSWVHEELNHDSDPRENKIYTQRILAHSLYPYSVRPDLKLRDTLKHQKIKDHVHIVMSSKNKAGTQGGILNIPFVNKFVPTVEMNMNFWIETVIENGKEILQLQYEQIILFEFHFGDDGGTTSWPHIQVNTLRKIEDLPEDQRLLIEEKFC